MSIYNSINDMFIIIYIYICTIIYIICLRLRTFILFVNKYYNRYIIDTIIYRHI